MHFRKFIWPGIWVSLALAVIFLSFSIFNQLYISPPRAGTSQAQHSSSEMENNDTPSGKSGDEVQDTIALPIIMYHGLVKDPSQQNQYFISPDRFEQDLAYLQEQGYSTVTMKQLINYVHQGTPLPEKPIVLTFDDGFYNNYLYAFPLLKQYDEKAVISILGSQTDRYSLIKINNSYYSYLTWNQINEMILSGHVEIQNHTYDMHTYDQGRKGCSEKSGESTTAYREKMLEDVGLLQQKITDYTGTTPNTIAYPFGYYSKESEAVIKEMGFQASLTCSQKVNKISRDPNSLYRLGRFLRPPDKSSASFFKDILKDT
ncbi:polysaccharide deacetylase family protein [Aminipila butyrica]|uniref:Polysaccharide deacetylase family protein n=1 Tax=Aminipila butyrica TaxID=433296 RepID=A0A858BWG4_9FIRM|nr:polysaccharide deacetylase family protein [Aminipila butyrica]QIB69240.1 polysaccharide deacetylase family protein [Aminipila butyrica]